MPDADILIHTGDFTSGPASLQQALDFNEWLGHLNYEYKFVILGNHEYKLQGANAWDPAQAKDILSNARVLEHEEVEVLGLRMFGPPWVRGHLGAAPGDTGTGHRFDKIPERMDILLTHGPPYGIMDYCENGGLKHYGGSQALRDAIIRAEPRVHLFGHTHEQRGVWHHKPGEAFSGGIEYVLPDGSMHPINPEIGPPPPGYPCLLISCNAMKNHPGVDGNDHDCIAGPARLIIAEKPLHGEHAWSFRVA